MSDPRLGCGCPHPPPPPPNPPPPPPNPPPEIRLQKRSVGAIPEGLEPAKALAPRAQESRLVLILSCGQMGAASHPGAGPQARRPPARAHAQAAGGGSPAHKAGPPGVGRWDEHDWSEPSRTDRELPTRSWQRENRRDRAPRARRFFIASWGAEDGKRGVSPRSARRL